MFSQATLRSRWAGLGSRAQGTGQALLTLKSEPLWTCSPFAPDRCAQNPTLEGNARHSQDKTCADMPGRCPPCVLAPPVQQLSLPAAGLQGQTASCSVSKARRSFSFISAPWEVSHSRPRRSCDGAGWSEAERERRRGREITGAGRAGPLGLCSSGLESVF